MWTLWHSVRGKVPLHLDTSVKLFKTLVRSGMEYAIAIWGILASAAELKRLDDVQIEFGRLLLRMPDNVARPYILRELGLESLRERSEVSALGLFGHLAELGDNRLSGYIFRKCCDEVDRGGARLSWCAAMKPCLQKYPLFHSRGVWQSRSPIPDWKQRVHEVCRGEFTADSDKQIHGMSSLSVFAELRPSESRGWLHRCLRHYGAEIRFKLRAGVLPLMNTICASRHKDIEKENRWCLLCETREVEDASHFVCVCPVFAAERSKCLAKIADTVAAVSAAVSLRSAMQLGNTVALLLGDSMLAELPPDTQLKVDRIVCNFLKVAWRKREGLWQKHCIDGDPWQLR